MALVVFTIKDTEDGSLDISAVAEPYIPVEEDVELTPAQIVAQVIAAAIQSVLAAGEEVEDSADEAEA